VEALYYVSRADRLAAVLKHALAKAEEAAANDELYEPHIYKEEQAFPLHSHVRHLLMHRKTKQPA
jgi:hypothetical protein